MEPTGLRQILCPTDFSDLSTLALAHATRLAERSGARLTLLYADSFLPPREFTSPQVEEILDSLKRERAGAESALQEYLRKHVPPGVSADAVVAVASPADAILAEAEARGADLIALGTHGRTGLNRLVMGSVAERVLAGSRTPVLAVRESPAEAAPGAEVRRILLPTNFSPAADAAMRQAVWLSELLGAELVVAHVAGEEEDPSDAHERVCAWVPEGVRAHCSQRHVVRHGDPAEQIIALAVEERVDLVVVGAQRRKLFDLSVFGTTTERVVRHAPTPVWVVPA